MIFKPGDTLTHRYDKARLDQMGIGIYCGHEFVEQMVTEFYKIKFTHFNNISNYQKKSMYNLVLYSDIFREPEITGEIFRELK